MKRERWQKCFLNSALVNGELKWHIAAVLPEPSYIRYRKLGDPTSDWHYGLLESRAWPADDSPLWPGFFSDDSGWEPIIFSEMEIEWDRMP